MTEAERVSVEPVGGAGVFDVDLHQSEVSQTRPLLSSVAWTPFPTTRNCEMGTAEGMTVSGDFNLEPGDSGLDALYNHDGGFGRFNESDETDRAFCPEARVDFQESCRAGEVTFSTFLLPKKLDYVFVSGGDFVEPHGEVL